MAKNLLIAAILVSAVTAVLGFVNHGKIADAKTQLEQAAMESSKNRAAVVDAQKKQKDAEATLAETEKDKSDLATQLSTAKADLESAESKSKESDQKIAEMDAKIKELQAQPTNSSGITQPETPAVDVTALNQRIQEQEAQISSLSEQLTTTKNKAAALETEKEQRAKSIMKKGLEGRVLAVNPAWNFVVLGIGDKQGVVSNAEMLLKRGDQYLGKVRVTSVEPSTSIADILVNTLPTGVSVVPGDSVIFEGND